jgi:hypothetical protein
LVLDRLFCNEHVLLIRANMSAQDTEINSATKRWSQNCLVGSVVLRPELNTVKIDEMEVVSERVLGSSVVQLCKSGKKIRSLEIVITLICKKRHCHTTSIQEEENVLDYLNLADHKAQKKRAKMIKSEQSLSYHPSQKHCFEDPQDIYTSPETVDNVNISRRNSVV